MELKLHSSICLYDENRDKFYLYVLLHALVESSLDIIIIIIILSLMELGHLLTRSGLTYPEFSSKICHDSFFQLGNSVSLPWVYIRHNDVCEW